MKEKFFAFALVVSAAFIGNAQAHSGGGGGGGGGGRGGGGGGMAMGGGRGGGSVAQGGFSRGGYYRSMGTRPYGGMMYPRMGGYPVYGGRGIGQSRVYSGRPTFSRTGQLASRNLSTSARFGNNSRFTQNGGRTVARANQGLRNGNNLRPNWQNHVLAQHSANWHSDWNRNHDHWWHGHRCCFFNGSWFVFDLGFDPWWPWWWDWYPYDYYGYGYPYGYAYPYAYGMSPPDAYPSAYDYGNQSTDSTVAAVQERLARDGYYHGQIDGVAGRQTQRAIARFQSNNRLPVTGQLTAETLASLGMRSAANY